MINLFDATAGFQGSAKGRCAECPPARSASTAERNNYLRWLASRDGVAVPSDAEFHDAGIWSRLSGEYVVPMPGYGQPQIVTCEMLDDDDNVIRRIPLPADKRGKLPMTAKQVQDWAGLAPVKAKRRKVPSQAPINAAPAPVIAAPIADASDPIAAIKARLADLERAVAALSAESAQAVQVEEECAGNAGAAHPTTVAKRTPSCERAIRRAWAERKEARKQREIGRNFREMLEVEEAAMRTLLGDLETAQAQAANARRAVDEQREVAAAFEQAWRDERAKRTRAIHWGRRVLRQARKQVKFQRQRGDVLHAQLVRLRADMADASQPERASDLARLIRERDEARTALAASHARCQRQDAAIEALAGELEKLASRVAIAEAALRRAA